jgi:hypothetical protein
MLTNFGHSSEEVGFNPKDGKDSSVTMTQISRINDIH